MAQIGTLGDIVFEVSDEMVKTFSNYSRKTSPRIAAHEIIGQKNVTEFLGPSIDSISFNIRLSAYFGIDPKEEADKLRTIAQKGEQMEFIIADAPVSECKWVIESMDETAAAHDGKGNIVQSDIHLTIREYVLRGDERASS